MAKRTFSQYDFSGGELSPSLAGETNDELFQTGARSMKNCMLLTTRKWKRRDGTFWLATLPGNARIFSAEPELGTVLILAFGNARVDVYASDGTLDHSITSAPWTTAMLDVLSVVAVEDKVYIAHQDMPPQVLTYASGTYTRAAFAFDIGGDGSTLQPYYQFEPGTTTLQLGGNYEAGQTATVTANPGFFTANHVGSSIRVGGCEIQIETYTSATTVSGTIIGDAPRTHEYTVEDAHGFAVGDVVQGEDSGAEGIVTFNNTGTKIQVFVYKYIEGFEDASGLRERIIGPRASSRITAAKTTVTQAAITYWDEQVFSSIRGYPGFVTVHTNRLWFANHKSLPGAAFASSALTLTDFDVGDGADDDAIFAILKDENKPELKYLASSSQLIAVSNRAAYYVPETDDKPITPGTMQFRRIGVIGAGDAPPIPVEQGVVLVDGGGNRIAGLLPTGQVGLLWEPYDLTRFADHLPSGVKDLAYAAGANNRPERFVYALNDTGNILVLLFQQIPSKLGWAPWETTEGDEWVSITTAGGALWAVGKRVINGSTTYCLEKFDPEAMMDAVKTFDDAADTVSAFANHPVHVIDGTRDYGEVTPNGSGAMTGIGSGTGDYQAGLFFTPEFRPFVPQPDTQDRPRGGLKRRRLVTLGLEVKDSQQFRIAGQVIPAYKPGEDTGEAPPLRTGLEIRKPAPSHSYDPNELVDQTAPVPLHVTAAHMEVSY